MSRTARLSTTWRTGAVRGPPRCHSTTSLLYRKTELALVPVKRKGTRSVAKYGGLWKTGAAERGTALRAAADRLSITVRATEGSWVLTPGPR